MTTAFLIPQKWFIFANAVQTAHFACKVTKNIFFDMLQTGLTYKSAMVVEPATTAEYIGSGDMAVLATPALAALMENAAMMAVAAELPEGSTTVGTRLELSHTKASAVGAAVCAEAVLTGIDGRRLTFSVEARDANGTIGTCTHERVVVDRQRFLEKVAGK